MSRFRFNFYLDIRKPLKSGLFSIKVNLYDGKDKRGINFTIKKVDGIEVSCNKKEWLDIWVNKEKKNSFGQITGEITVYGHKSTIRNILKIKEDILNDVILFDNVNSLQTVKDAFYDYVEPTSYTDDVYLEFKSKIFELDNLNRFKTRDSYQYTLDSIKEHNNERPFKFSDVSVFWLDGYERAKKSQGLSTASIAIHMRNLRAVYNRVKDGDVYLLSSYPFGNSKGKYTIKEAVAKNKGLKIEDLKKIQKFSSSNTSLQFARDVFIFSYYSGGMNWKDLIKLTKKNIEDKYFIRSKTEFTTKQEIKIPLEINDVQREIINRYKAFFIDRNGNKVYKGKRKYLFNFLSDDATAIDIYKVQKNGLSKFDKQIKKLAKELDLNEKLSYNWARHSFSTNMHKAGGVSERLIQESMGHSSTNTTRKYIDSLIDEERGAINKALNLGDDRVPSKKDFFIDKNGNKIIIADIDVTYD